MCRETDGTLVETHIGAIQHDLADVPEDATLVGVVRNPEPWFLAVVDENYPELGPPAELLESRRELEAELKLRGLCADGAADAAWEQLDIERQYRRHLEHSVDTQTAIDRLRDRLANGDSLVLVGDERTAKTQSHRTILRDRLERDSS